MQIPCGHCDHPSLCEYCFNGELDEEGIQKLKSISENSKNFELIMATNSCRP